MRKLFPIILALVILVLTAGNVHALSTDFIATWDTTATSTGSSAYTQVTLPLENGGTYNFVASWGDGYTSTVTAWDDVDKTHTYSLAGVYTITITGTCYGFRFNNTGDKLKIKDISQWGNLRVGNNNGYFYGCANLTGTATDNLDLTNTTDLSYMFDACSIFNQDISSWNISSVTNMSRTFYRCYLFNQNIGLWNMAKTTVAIDMLREASAFNQDISDWTITACTNMSNILLSSGLSTANYDKILNCWATQSVKSSVPFGVGTKTYDSGSPATSRAHLVNTHGWIITDGGASGSAWTEPVAAFSGTPLAGFPGLSVPFTDASTGTPTAWDWDWGDGTTHGTTQNPTHVYAGFGTYPVTLTVTKDCITSVLTKPSYVVTDNLNRIIPSN
jgi:surface protein